MSRASTFRSGRSGNPKVEGSNPNLAVSNPDQVKPTTVKLIFVTPWPDAQHY